MKQADVGRWGHADFDELTVEKGMSTWAPDLSTLVVISDEKKCILIDHIFSMIVQSSHLLKTIYCCNAILERFGIVLIAIIAPILEAG